MSNTGTDSAGAGGSASRAPHKASQLTRAGGGAWRPHTSPPPATRQRAGLLRAYSADGARCRIEFQSASESRDRFEAFVALLESGLASNVKAGENSGRKLAHDFVVRQIESAALSP